VRNAIVGCGIAKMTAVCRKCCGIAVAIHFWSTCESAFSIAVPTIQHCQYKQLRKPEGGEEAIAPHKN